MSNLLLLTLYDISGTSTCGTYSLFDSHLRDVIGNPTPEESDVLLTFDCIGYLIQYFLRLYPNILCIITPVIFGGACVNRASTPSTDHNSSGQKIQTSAKFVGIHKNTYESKKGGKYQESIHSSTTPDPGLHMGK